MANIKKIKVGNTIYDICDAASIHGSIVQITGESETDIMSQKAVTNAINDTGGSGGNSELESRIEALEEQVSNLTYMPIDITSFTNNIGSIVEDGRTITDVILSWEVNKTPASMSLDDVTLTEKEIASGRKEMTLQNITTTKTFTLVATGDNKETDKAITTIAFGKRVFYGVAEKQESYDSSFVNSLDSKLITTRSTLLSATAGDDEYIYYASPVSLGECSFYLDGLSFEGGLSKIGVVRVSLKYYDDDVEYYLYRSDNPNLGDTTIQIK